MLTMKPRNFNDWMKPPEFVASMASPGPSTDHSPIHCGVCGIPTLVEICPKCREWAQAILRVYAHSPRLELY